MRLAKEIIDEILAHEQQAQDIIIQGEREAQEIISAAREKSKSMIADAKKANEQKLKSAKTEQEEINKHKAQAAQIDAKQKCENLAALANQRQNEAVSRIIEILKQP